MASKIIGTPRIVGSLARSRRLSCSLPPLHIPQVVNKSMRHDPPLRTPTGNRHHKITAVQSMCWRPHFSKPTNAFLFDRQQGDLFNRHHLFSLKKCSRDPDDPPSGGQIRVTSTVVNHYCNEHCRSTCLYVESSANPQFLFLFPSHVVLPRRIEHPHSPGYPH